MQFNTTLCNQENKKKNNIVLGGRIDTQIEHKFLYWTKYVFQKLEGNLMENSFKAIKFLKHCKG